MWKTQTPSCSSNQHVLKSEEHTQYKSLVSHSTGCHIFSCALLTAEKKEQNLNFRLSSSTARIHSYKQDFCNGDICTVSPCIESEKASIIMFSISVTCGRGCSQFCLCWLSSQQKPKREGPEPWDLLSHISDHTVWQGKHLAAVCTPKCTASDNRVLSEMPKCYRKIHWRSR